MARRIPVFFASGGYRAYGSIFTPDAAGPERRGMVLCPPFADEAVHAHRVLVTLARRLAEAGLIAFLIDYAGTGDSEGSFEAGTLDRYVDDILAAGAYLRAEAGVARCGLLGLRLGGNLASRAAARDPSLSPLVLWAGLADVPTYFRRFLRLRLFARSAVVAAAEDPRVRGVAAWAMPLWSDADPAPAAELDRAIGQLGKRAIPVLWTFGTRDPALGAFHAYLEGVAARPSGGHRAWTVARGTP